MIINYQQLNTIYLILKIKYKPVKDVLDEIRIHIYKNLIKGAYYRSEKYVKKTINKKTKT